MPRFTLSLVFAAADSCSLVRTPQTPPVATQHSFLVLATSVAARVLPKSNANAARTRKRQAASLADPVGHCLALEEGPLAEGLGLFTCIADTRFFLNALGAVLRFPSVLAVDVGGDDPHRLPDPSNLGHTMGAGGGSAFYGRDSETVPETMLQV